MEQHDFKTTKPPVPWDILLDRLGLSLDAARRKKLLGVLAVDTGLQDQVRALEVTEAGLRAIGRLDSADQKHLVEEIAKDPDLGRRVRRIADLRGNTLLIGPGRSTRQSHLIRCRRKESAGAKAPYP
jgi:hypothetical protein